MKMKYDIKRLLDKVVLAVEIEHWTTYKQISEVSGVPTVSLWRIIKQGQNTTIKTANKIAYALEKIKKDKKNI